MALCSDQMVSGQLVSGVGRMVSSVLALLLALVIVLAPGLAQAERRVALVVGNSAYAHFEPLPNAARDARDIAAALEARGFEVTLLRDTAHPDFLTTLETFALRAAGADVALFYFSGHGFQVNGTNYLAPVNATITRLDQIDTQTLRLDDVIARISAPGRRSIILLDACRNDPLPSILRGAGAPGLALPETGRDTFVAFATQPGNLTYDGVEGQNSPFTEALLRHMGTEGQAISQMMIAVRNQVEDRTAGRQIPWDQSSLTMPFFFNPFQPTERDLADLAGMSPSMQDRILNLWRAQGMQITQAAQPDAMAEAELPDFSGALILLDEGKPEELADSEPAPQQPAAPITQAEAVAQAEPITQVVPQLAAIAAVVPQRRPAQIGQQPARTAPVAQIGQQPARTAPVAQTGTRPQVSLHALVPPQAVAEEQAPSRREAVTLAALPQSDQRVARSVDQSVGITRALPLAQLSAPQMLAPGGQSSQPDAPIAWLASLPPARRTQPLPGQRRIIGTDVTPPEAPPEPVAPVLSPEELAVAIQTELQRVGCYRGRIDGDFGPGSRRALRDYFSGSGQRATGEDPSLEILEQVRLTSGTICAAPVARETPRPQAPAAAQSRSPAPAAPAAAPSGTNADRLRATIRVFR